MQIETIDQAAAELSRAAFTAETATIEAAASFLAKRLVERRNTIPILSMIQIAASPAGHITLTGSDLDNWATVTVPADVTSPGAVCIDAATLAGQLTKLRKAKAETVTIEHTDQGRAAIKAGRTRFNAPTLPVDDFPLTPTGELADAAPLSRFAVPAGRFLADLAALAPCQSTEETRYYLNGIALQVRDMAGQDRLTMAATDGHNIGIASRELPAGAETLPDCIMARKTVALIDKAVTLAPDAEMIDIEFDPSRGGGIFRLQLGPVLIEAKAIDGTFPDWARPFEEMLAPTDEADAPLFPELIPGTPLAAMAKLGKGAGGLDWQDAASGKLGTVPGDDGLLFGALNLRSETAEPIKGYRYSYNENDAAALAYLEGLAVLRSGPLPAEWGARLCRDGDTYHGATIGKSEWQAGRYEERPNWETLAIERVYIEPSEVWQEGSYSILMPRERTERRCDVSLEIEGDNSVYPIAVNSGGKIHLSTDQVRGQIGESCFETMAVPIPNNHPLYRVFRNHPAFVARWCYDQGDTRLLIVSKTGRCFDPKKYARDYLLRSEIDTLIAGTWQPGDECATPEPIRFEEPEAAMLESPEAEPVEICQQEPQESESEPCPVSERWEAIEALSGPEIEMEAISDDSENVPTDPFTDLVARVAALEARLSAPLPGELSPAPAMERAKRTPAHERAIRRAWAERKAARAARWMIQLRSDQLDNANRSTAYWRELSEAETIRANRADRGRRRAVTRALALRAALAAKRNAYTEAELQAAVAVERERAADLQRELVEAKASNAGVADGAGVAAAQAAAQMARAIEAEEGREALRAELDRERAALAAVTERNARLLQSMADLAERVERAEAAIAA